MRIIEHSYDYFKPFSKILEGEAFLWGGQCYIKHFPIKNEKTITNAICLSKGNGVFIDNDAEPIPVAAEISILKSKGIARFDELKRGEVFRWQSRWYIVCDKHSANTNAICLNNGELALLDDANIVTPYIVKLHTNFNNPKI